MAFKPGENVGPYRVIEQLGQGGMASVYKAYHAALDRYVALKVLHQAFNEDSTFINRFQREARVVAKLEHPNIVPIYDYAEHEGRPYLVMKFIEGDTLKARMNEGPLSAREIDQVVETVGSALGYAHRQGVLHRDIKPSNVLISNEGVMYLADFGLARIAEAGESTLSADSIMGTPQYISPEQAMGKKDLDGKTDIYSFGVMLYEIVVGQVPFNADTPFSIIHDHIYTPLPLPMDVNPKVPEPVQRVLLKALAKDRLDRFETVEELIGAFKSAWLEAGIPMRGTDITMRFPAKNSEPVKKAMDAPRVRSAEMPVPASGPKQKRTPWMWVGVGLVTILCFGFGLLALRNTLTIFSQSVENTSTPAAQLPPNAQLPPPAPGTLPPNGQLLPPPSGNNNPTPTVIPPDQMSAEVAAAYELVTKSPGDPNAHLQLSLAFWDAGLEQASIEELGQASNLAGPDSKDFYLTAAQEYAAREAWILAARMYINLGPIYRIEGTGIPEDIKDALRESLYKAADHKDFLVLLPFDQIEKLNGPLASMVRARYTLYNGDANEAAMLAANVEKMSPDLIEVHLLKAEIAIKNGNMQEARTILLKLSQDTAAPDWVRTMAEEYLKSIQ
ncbi:MAG: protein kinase [Anaerolineales bacterium]|nr:protein kinase [Anaerolineales bacterium]